MIEKDELGHPVFGLNNITDVDFKEVTTLFCKQAPMMVLEVRRPRQYLDIRCYVDGIYREYDKTKSIADLGNLSMLSNLSFNYWTTHPELTKVPTEEMHLKVTTNKSCRILKVESNTQMMYLSKSFDKYSEDDLLLFTQEYSLIMDKLMDTSIKLVEDTNGFGSVSTRDNIEKYYRRFSESRLRFNDGVVTLVDIPRVETEDDSSGDFLHLGIKLEFSNNSSGIQNCGILGDVKLFDLGVYISLTQRVYTKEPGNDSNPNHLVSTFMRTKTTMSRDEFVSRRKDRNMCTHIFLNEHLGLLGIEFSESKSDSNEASVEIVKHGNTIHETK